MVRFPGGRVERSIALGEWALGRHGFGKTSLERVRLNEDSLWYGGPGREPIPTLLNI